MKEFWTLVALAETVWWAIWDFIVLVFNITFAQFWKVLYLLGNFQSYVLWKQVLIVVVILAFLALLALTFLEIASFIWTVIRSAGSMIASLGSNFLYILLLALIAFGGANVINNHRSIAWLNWLP